MRRVFLGLVAFLTTFLIGFYIRHLLPENAVLDTLHSCQSIARAHQDYLMSKYDIDPGFNTDQNNPKRDINQRASDLNAQLLSICDTSPLVSQP